MHPRLLHINTSHILFFPLLSYCPTILHTHRQRKSSSVFPGMLPDPLRCHLLKGRQLLPVYRNGCTDKAQDNSLCMTSAPSIPHHLGQQYRYHFIPKPVVPAYYTNSRVPNYRTKLKGRPRSKSFSLPKAN